MSFMTTLKKKSTLNAATKQISKARNSETAKADELFKSAYEGFEFVLSDNLMISESLYNWGLGLLHQAKSKQGDEAIDLYEAAINKFSFCLTMDRYYLGAAIDGGVAYMDLARLLNATSEDKNYQRALKLFQQAETIQKGTAAYNLACLHSVSNNTEACIESLKIAKEFGSLPDDDEINQDPDMEFVINSAEFIKFMSMRAEEIEAEKEAVAKLKEEKRLAKLKAKQKSEGVPFENAAESEAVTPAAESSSSASDTGSNDSSS